MSKVAVNGFCWNLRTETGPSRPKARQSMVQIGKPPYFLSRKMPCMIRSITIHSKIAKPAGNLCPFAAYCCNYSTTQPLRADQAGDDEP